MTPRTDFDELLTQWLTDDGPSDVPPRVALAAIETVRSMPVSGHRQTLGPGGWRSSTAGATRRLAPARTFRLLAVAAALALLCVVTALAIGMLQRSPMPSPSVIDLPGNGRIAVVEDGDIVLIDPASGAREVLTTGPDQDLVLSFSPDGKWFAWWSQPVGGGFVLQYQELTPGADLQGLELGTPGEIAWSRELGYLSVSQIRDGQTVMTLVDRMAGAFRDVSGVDQPSEASWRPDGRALVVRGLTTDGAGLYLVPTFGGDPVLLATSDPASRAGDGTMDLMEPAWSPDGRMIAFSSSVATRATGTDGRRVFVMNADGSGRRMLEHSNTSVTESGPTWAADSSRLLVRVRGADTTSLVLLPVDGTASQVVATLPGTGWHTAWSPDETTIAAARIHEPATLIDVATGVMTPQSWTSAAGIAWQAVP